MLARIAWILRTAILTNALLLDSESNFPQKQNVNRTYMRRSEQILRTHAVVYATLLKAHFSMAV